MGWKKIRGFGDDAVDEFQGDARPLLLSMTPGSLEPKPKVG